MNRYKFLLSIQCLLFSSAIAANTVDVVRHVKDAFSNPSCISSDCPANSNCFSGSCCKCQCSYSKSNFLVKGWECKSNADTEAKTNAGCAFTIRPDNEPLEVLLTTEEANGKVKFTSGSVNPVRVNCSNDVIVDQWYYLNAHDQWIQGVGDSFLVEHRTVGGPTKDKKDLSFLKWGSTLDPRYSGLLIRIMLQCKDSHRIGCLLAKLNGTYTYDRDSAPATTPPPSTTSSPTTATPTSTAPPPQPNQETTPAPDLKTTTRSNQQATTENTPLPDVHATTEGKGGPDGGQPQNPTKNPANPGPDQQVAVTHKVERQSSTPAGSIIGVIGGILALVCLLCLLFVAYRKRKTCMSWIAKKRNERDSPDANAGTYEDPIYAEVPENCTDFDNPVYCDPADENLNRRSKQDPLPLIPGSSEPSYQPLNEMTRSNDPQGPNPPQVPQVSYPKGEDNEAYEYAMPSKENKAKDYENPPPITFNQGNQSSDYDNPPLTTNNLGNESSDYDNPPLTTNIDSSLNETLDYDNPPQTSPPVNYEPPTVEIVPGNSTDDQPGDGPEYYELEPEDTSM